MTDENTNLTETEPAPAKKPAVKRAVRKPKAVAENGAAVAKPAKKREKPAPSRRSSATTMP